MRRAALLPNDRLTIANKSFRVHVGPPDVVPCPEEHTQQMNAADLGHLRPKEVIQAVVESSADIHVLEIQRNALPDVYPEE